MMNLNEGKLQQANIAEWGRYIQQSTEKLYGLLWASEDALKKATQEIKLMKEFDDDIDQASVIHSLQSTIESQLSSIDNLQKSIELKETIIRSIKYETNNKSKMIKEFRSEVFQLNVKIKELEGRLSKIQSLSGCSCDEW